MREISISLKWPPLAQTGISCPLAFLNLVVPLTLPPIPDRSLEKLEDDLRELVRGVHGWQVTHVLHDHVVTGPDPVGNVLQHLGGSDGFVVLAPQDHHLGVMVGDARQLVGVVVVHDGAGAGLVAGQGAGAGLLQGRFFDFLQAGRGEPAVHGGAGEVFHRALGPPLGHARVPFGLGHLQARHAGGVAGDHLGHRARVEESVPQRQHPAHAAPDHRVWVPARVLRGRLHHGVHVAREVVEVERPRVAVFVRTRGRGFVMAHVVIAEGGVARLVQHGYQGVPHVQVGHQRVREHDQRSIWRTLVDHEKINRVDRESLSNHHGWWLGGVLVERSNKTQLLAVVCFGRRT